MINFALLTVIYFQVFLSNTIAQLTGAVEYPDCISEEG